VISCGRRVLETHLAVSWRTYGGKGRMDKAVDRRNESTPNHVKHVETSIGGQMQPFKISDTTGASLEDCTQLIADLLSFGQALSKHPHRVGQRLCQEVMRATQGRAWLVLPGQDSSTGRPAPFPVSVSFPVRFRNRIYGTLEIAPDPAHPASPALPLPVAQLLAHTCGSLLYTLELSAFIEGQCQRLDYQDPEHLTKREQDIPLAAYRAHLFSILE